VTTTPSTQPSDCDVDPARPLAALTENGRGHRVGHLWLLPSIPASRYTTQTAEPGSATTEEDVRRHRIGSRFEEDDENERS